MRLSRSGSGDELSVGGQSRSRANVSPSHTAGHRHSGIREGKAISDARADRSLSSRVVRDSQ
jgi:hypothetical protein